MLIAYTIAPIVTVRELDAALANHASSPRNLRNTATFSAHGFKSSVSSCPYYWRAAEGSLLNIPLARCPRDRSTAPFQMYNGVPYNNPENMAVHVGAPPHSEPMRKRRRLSDTVADAAFTSTRNR